MRLAGGPPPRLGRKRRDLLRPPRRHGPHDRADRLLPHRLLRLREVLHLLGAVPWVSRHHPGAGPGEVRRIDGKGAGVEVSALALLLVPPAAAGVLEAPDCGLPASARRRRKGWVRCCTSDSAAVCGMSACKQRRGIFVVVGNAQASRGAPDAAELRERRRERRHRTFCFLMMCPEEAAGPGLEKMKKEQSSIGESYTRKRRRRPAAPAPCRAGTGTAAAPAAPPQRTAPPARPVGGGVKRRGEE